ncbi:MAG: helix-turn-helix transcriptional regulator, partial [Victivallales bacterium]|nr:helix-turn-helix transcriptional regulator [Victivallales bacterium]
TQAVLAEKSGLSQGGINEFLNGKAQIQNMTVGTLLKLFPEIEIRFFRDDPLADDIIPSDLRDIVDHLNGYSVINRHILIGRIWETIKHHKLLT